MDMPAETSPITPVEKKPKVSRRDFLRFVVFSGVSVFLQSCIKDISKITETPPPPTRTLPPPVLSTSTSIPTVESTMTPTVIPSETPPPTMEPTGPFPTEVIGFDARYIDFAQETKNTKAALDRDKTDPKIVLTTKTAILRQLAIQHLIDNKITNPSEDQIKAQITKIEANILWEGRINPESSSWSWIAKDKNSGAVYITQTYNDKSKQYENDYSLTPYIANYFNIPYRMVMVTPLANEEIHIITANNGTNTLGFFDKSTHELTRWLNPTVNPTEPTLVENQASLSSVDINNPDTWPKEMQAYWNSILGRNDLRKGKTDEEIKVLEAQWLVEDNNFDIFVKKGRKIFLTDKVKKGLVLNWEGESVNVENLTDEQPMWLYLKYNLDNKQVSTISLTEARNFQITTKNIVDSLSYTGDCTTCENGAKKLFSGVVGDGRFKQQYIEQILKGEIKGWYDIPGGNLPLFGVSDNYRSYDNFFGNLIGLFRLPGIKPKDGVGVLGYFRNHQGVPRLLATDTPFIFVTYPAGRMSLDGNSYIVYYQSEYTERPAFTNEDLRPNFLKYLTLEETLNQLGFTVSFERTLTTEGGFILPFNLGLQEAGVFGFYNNLTTDSYPWEEYINNQHRLNVSIPTPTATPTP